MKVLDICECWEIWASFQSCQLMAELDACWPLADGKQQWCASRMQKRIALHDEIATSLNMKRCTSMASAFDGLCVGHATEELMLFLQLRCCELGA